MPLFPAADSLPCMAEHSTFLAGFLSCMLLAMQADSIPSVSEDGATVRVMAGQHNSTVGPIKMRNPGLLMDVTVEKGGKFVQEVGTPGVWLRGAVFAYRHASPRWSGQQWHV